MKKKIELLKECAWLMKKPSVELWYKENMESDPQADTVKALATGVSSGKLTIEEALSIALIVGVQWEVKFEGVS